MRQYTAITVLSLLVASGCEQAAGRFAFEPSEFDLQGDFSGADQDVTFMLRNVGGAPLDIAKITPSCSCTTVAALEVTHLPGGAKVEVKLRVSPPAYGRTDVMVVAQAVSPEAPPAVALLRLHGSSSVPELFTLTRRVEMTGTVRTEELTGIVELLTDEKATADPWVSGLESTSSDVTAELIERKVAATLSAVPTCSSCGERCLRPARRHRVSNCRPRLHATTMPHRFPSSR